MRLMQVLALGLVLVLSWTGWASSATVDPRKTLGRWYHVFTASHDLEVLSDNEHLRFYSPYFRCFNLNCNAISLYFQFRYMGYCNQRYKVLEKQHEGLYQTTVPPANILQIVDVGDSMLLLGYHYRSSSHNTYSVLALGRESTLSEADMENFQKVLQQKGIMAEPMRFTGNDFCTSDFMVNTCIDVISRD